MFFWRQRIEPNGPTFGVEWAVTDRLGGSSQGRYAEFNLGGHVGDLPEAVETNRHRLARELGLRLADLRFMDQQHGCAVALTPATGIARGDGGQAAPVRSSPLQPELIAPAADGIVSGVVDEALVVLVADCVPVLLVDRKEGLAAAVHAGRPGMVAGVVTATVHRLRELGGSALEAVVGPSVCPRCYEVPAQMRSQAAEVEPVAASVTRQGTPAVDVGAGVAEQLMREGVELTWLPGCTRERDDLYSYRRDGATGRFAGVIRLLAPEQVA
ncbi:polyphenol oxidase family protein [Ornithinimicrobium pratense]|uniref:Laccase domain-containing protein n=1 Tax=Ornithinimicrobium pratense TaxID=2593973 RepID=A0A5J6V4D1_9MICO|nr:polyphenol oxidase family protein [Ornithinimicrobium pratense]QFG68144.1 laccase domain-containing protein [Ornithinimicrobium pratense]